MMAAATMAGKYNINGFPSDHRIIDLLIEAGANKDAIDSLGLTAYGTFKQFYKNHCLSMDAMLGRRRSTEDEAVPSHSEITQLLQGAGLIASTSHHTLCELILFIFRLTKVF